MKEPLWFAVFLLFLTGCTKDKIERNYSASTIIASNDLLLGGGCLDQDGNLIVFSPPTFELVSHRVGDFIRHPSFKKYNGNGQLIQEYSLPPIKWQYNQGSATWDTINGVVEAWDPGLKVTLAVNKRGEIINANSTSGLISNYVNGSNSGIIQLERVSAISVDANDTIFALMSPTYNRDRSLKNPPEIWKINADGTTTTFYVFPSYYSYPVGNMWGNGQDNFPDDKPDDIYIGNDGFVYIAMGNTNKTFKISKSGQMEELTTDILAPVSLSMDKAGNIFVVAAPLIDSIDFSVVKPIEVIEIKTDKSRQVIYSGSTGQRFRGSLINCEIPGKWVGIGSTIDVSVSSNGDVFLVNPIEHELIRIY